MSATHDADIIVNLLLGPPPSATPGYRLLYIAALADNSLNGEDFLAFGTVGEVDDAESAGYISAATASALKTVLAQQPKPDLVYCGAVDLVGTETYPDALSRLEGILGDQFFFVSSDTTTAAIHVALSLACEQSTRRVYIFQDDDGDWLTSGLPGDYSALEGREQTLVIYYDDSDRHDMAYGGCLSGVDPTVLSGSPTRQLRAVGGLDNPITLGQRANIFANNCNVGLPFGTASVFLKNGRNCNNRPINEIVTREYLTREIVRRVAQQNLRLQPAPWPLNLSGRALLQSLLESLAQDAIEAGHINPGQVIIDVKEITPTDINDKRIRADFTAQVGSAVVRWNIGGTLDTLPVITEE